MMGTSCPIVLQPISQVSETVPRRIEGHKIKPAGLSEAQAIELMRLAGVGDEAEGLARRIEDNLAVIKRLLRLSS